MKIAQVAPLLESVPPKLYGGTERIVSYLTEELVRQGHDVTLFASGDSVTSARLRPMCDHALRLSRGPLVDPLAYHLLELDRVAEEAEDFDIVHFHLDYYPFSLIRRFQIPAVTTLHGRLDIPDLQPVFSHFRDINLISISNAQRAPMPWAHWVATVYHGLPAELHSIGNGGGGYFAFLGRISPEKRVDRAIEISKRVGIPLRIAAKIDAADNEYYEEQIHPLLKGAEVEFDGEIGEADKQEFLGNARALLFPIDWPEPFGLVMIEAMACGTPVIAFEGGSVKEIVEDGISGFVVKNVEEAVDAAKKLDTIDRAKCRARFEERFSAKRMCQDYVRAYHQVLASRCAAVPPLSSQKFPGESVADVLANTE